MEAKICEITGARYYEKLPPTANVVTKTDFYRKDGSLKIGVWYLIFSYQYEVYYARKIKADFDMQKIEPWLNDKRVYMKN